MEVAPQSRCTRKHCMTMHRSVEPPSSSLGPPLSPSCHHPVCYGRGENGLKIGPNCMKKCCWGFQDKKGKGFTPSFSSLPPSSPHSSPPSLKALLDAFVSQKWRRYMFGLTGLCWSVSTMGQYNWLTGVCRVWGHHPHYWATLLSSPSCHYLISPMSPSLSPSCHHLSCICCMSILWKKGI